MIPSLEKHYKSGSKHLYLTARCGVIKARLAWQDLALLIAFLDATYMILTPSQSLIIMIHGNKKPIVFVRWIPIDTKINESCLVPVTGTGDARK
jgi:hypothetical protein